ncbi:unnamed protein product, partial [Musa acuminata subsp. burmannicoides]
MISPFSDRSQMSQQIEFYNRFPEFNNYLVIILVSAEVVSSSSCFSTSCFCLRDYRLSDFFFFFSFEVFALHGSEKRYPDIIDHAKYDFDICFTPQFLYTYECIPEQRGTCCPCPPFMDRTGPADDPCIIQL